MSTRKRASALPSEAGVSESAVRTTAVPAAAARMPLLDAAKGLACALIVGHHLARYGPLPAGASTLAPGLFEWLAQDGRLAVQVFLVIAGFLAAGSLAPDGVLRIDRPLGQQPGDDVHDPGCHLERLAGEADPRERLERHSLLATAIVEIGPRLIGQQHRLGVKRVDKTRRNPHLRFGLFRFVHG